MSFNAIEELKKIRARIDKAHPAPGSEWPTGEIIGDIVSFLEKAVQGETEQTDSNPPPQPPPPK